MAIQQVRVQINNTWHTLSSTDGSTYTATIASPNVTSYNVNANHYYPVTVEATNMAGTVTTKTDTDPTLGSQLRLYVRETTAPTITIVSPTENQYLGTATPTFEFNITDEVNGSGVKISSLQLTIDDDVYGNTDQGMNISSITNGYKVIFTPTTGLTDGSHTFTISVEDNDGNDGNTIARTFTTDTLAPTLSVTNPSTDGTYTATAAYTITGTTSDATSGVPTVTIKLNDADQGAVTVSSGSFSKQVTLTEGSNTIVVTATDMAGKSTTITRTIILDSSAPIIASINIVPNPVNVGNNYVVTITVQ